MFEWLPVAYRRLFIVLAILFVLAAPTAYIVMRSQTKTAQDFVEEAERHRAEGNIEQARLSTDKAVSRIRQRLKPSRRIRRMRVVG